MLLDFPDCPSIGEAVSKIKGKILNEKLTKCQNVLMGTTTQQIYGYMKGHSGDENPRVKTYISTIIIICPNQLKNKK